MVASNWACFGAPAALFCYIDRDMGSAQWADLGMYLQRDGDVPRLSTQFAN
ncbi:MAG TPA: hypothetical protein VNZ26_18050 [Vicinamibacterales bacterium]|nr:hypothetical protein [Vicinamibacterales bacterium]